MHQLEFFEIPSPCIGVCQSGPNGYCLGCFRSRDERLHWLALDDEVKRKVIRAARRRKHRAALKSSKQAGVLADSPGQGTLFDDGSNQTPNG